MCMHNYTCGSYQRVDSSSICVSVLQVLLQRVFSTSAFIVSKKPSSLKPKKVNQYVGVLGQELINLLNVTTIIILSYALSNL